jgi:hypothetical protein
MGGWTEPSREQFCAVGLRLDITEIPSRDEPLIISHPMAAPRQSGSVDRNQGKLARSESYGMSQGASRRSKCGRRYQLRIVRTHTGQLRLWEKVMNKIMSGIVACTLSASIAASAAFPANAMPMFVPLAPAATDNVQTVEARNGPRWIRRPGNHHFHRRIVRNDGVYWNGHRGYREYRPGYRRHGDLWFPLAAFAVGAVIGSAIANDQNRVYAGNAHIQWCYDHYRSYRASDNTFQPYHGPRRQCRSPY